MSISGLYHGSVCLVNTFEATNVFSKSGSIGRVMQDESIAERLQRLRKAKGLSQTALAARAGVGQSAIGNIEAGLRGYGASVVDIATALDTTPEYLQLKDQARANAGKRAAGELTTGAMTVAAIFDWLEDPIQREEVRNLMTQEVLTRLRPSSAQDRETEPQETPTALPDRPGRAKK